ncbi:MAG TPA: helix-turn-helix domain-containing protein [Pseudonocardia sp.]
MRRDPFRDAQAARLKAAGLTLDEIGGRMGVSRATAHRMVRRALREYVARPYDEARQLAEAELDQLARQGVLAAPTSCWGYLRWSAGTSARKTYRLRLNR